jgi:hypothetical protein
MDKERAMLAQLDSTISPYCQGQTWQDETFTQLALMISASILVASGMNPCRAAETARMLEILIRQAPVHDADTPF